ncbi:MULTISPECIES: DUF805 domain-containing protein [unclassified Phenylobacterium]|uniref:DUF805 domain-containing protein n=1 Tax=unclassified Phenylobacterium TaxID=2640670 RepID=UPI00083B8638|nr:MULTISPECIES: DUF805 domain-containing protein [unclassified Phenylobacterium]
MSDRLESAAAGRAEPSKDGFGRWIAGRARRREYWALAAPWFIAATAVAMMAPGFEIVLGPLLLLLWIRRLHDLGFTGWFAPLINVAVAIVGWIERGVLSAGGDGGGLAQGLVSLAALAILGLVPGQPHANRYGPPPGKRDLAETFS